MTLIEKIKQSVEGATVMPFLYHAAGELNELIARAAELPVAFAFLLDSGTIEDVNGRYHERVTLAVMFTDKTQFDFNALENEEIIDRMKLKAYKWLESLRNSNDLQIVSVNSTQRLYDTTTDVLTGYAVNITLQDMYGAGECELPEVVIDLNKNGSYNVVGVDKVRVNVVPRLEELEVKQNGEYLPPTDIAGFSKVNVDVQPILEELTVTQDGIYTPQEGVDGFSKVVAEFDTSSLPKVKLASSFKVTNACINANGRWDGENMIDTSECTSFENTFSGCSSLLEIDANWDTKKVKTIRACFSGCTNLKRINGIDKWDVSGVSNRFSCRETFLGCSNLEELHLGEWKTSLFTVLDSTFKYCRKLHTLDVSGWNTSKVVSFNFVFEQCNVLKELDLTSWSVESFKGGWSMQGMFNGTEIETIVGGRTIEDVISNNITCLRSLAYTPMGLSFPGKLDRASLRAVINGLADLTGQTAQTLTLGAILLAKLTEEDIAIATNKNWTIV